MRDCDGIQELLSAYADGEAGEGERRRVEGHLAFCGACRLRMRWINGTKAALAGLPFPALPPDLKARLVEETPATLRGAESRWDSADGAKRRLGLSGVGLDYEKTRGEGLIARGQALPRRPAWGYGLAAGLALAALVVAVRLPDSGEEIPLEAMLAAHHQYAASFPASAPEPGSSGPAVAAEEAGIDD